MTKSLLFLSAVVLLVGAGCTGNTTTQVDVSGEANMGSQEAEMETDNQAMLDLSAELRTLQDTLGTLRNTASAELDGQLSAAADLLQTAETQVQVAANVGSAEMTSQASTALAAAKSALMQLEMRVSADGDTMDNDSDDMMDDMDDDEMSDDDTDSADAGAVRYTISDDSTVSYTVSKEWLNKPFEDVTGVNSSVEGTITYDASVGELTNISVTVDADDFDSGSGGRDDHVAGMLNTISIASSQSVSAGPGDFSVTVPVVVTINGTSQTVSFPVTGVASETRISAQGSASVSFTDFNIEPPSALGVYGVSDAFTISFSVSSEA